MASLFKVDIKKLKGVGDKSAECLNRLGINSVGELINFFPRDYEDWTKVTSISEACNKKLQCMKIKVINFTREQITSGRVKVYKNRVTDGTDTADLVFFNNKYLAMSFVAGREYVIRGDVKKGRNLSYEITSVKLFPKSDTLIIPTYRQVNGITSGKIANLIRNALELLPKNLPETLPDEIIDEYNLCSYDFAIKNIHFPKDEKSLKDSRNRIIFESFFIYQLSMGFIKSKSRVMTEVKIKEDKTNEFVDKLPFRLTDSQLRSISECMNDMLNGKYAMNRLLQGDVGSGKTVVAAALAYNAVVNGYQVAIMAPTEILASQHYSTFLNFFGDTDINIRLICGSNKKRERRILCSELEMGIANIVIGTHALISEGINFKNLGLVVTDEQHRFGVNQRCALFNKGDVPHTLVMSATPIPRTLALIVYGDLDMSILNETLPGRQKIDTFKIDDSKRLRALKFLRDIVNDGGQGYIVCAGIDENEDNDIVDVNSYYEKNLKDLFSEEEVSILHGKMHPTLKEQIMRLFVEGKIKVLISTTVVEVGVDVANARVMIIENAERFGISQLHQLRGRVGRSNQKSYCVLISNSKSKDSARRFSAMENSGDGFYLSEEDLKLRGPGDFFGVNQHGAPNIKIPTKYEDIYLVRKAQEAAINFLNSGANLDDQKYRFIRQKIKKHFCFDDEEKNQGVTF